jgi:hypothetical protein
MMTRKSGSRKIIKAVINVSKSPYINKIKDVALSSVRNMRIRLANLKSGQVFFKMLLAFCWTTLPVQVSRLLQQTSSSSHADSCMAMLADMSHATRGGSSVGCHRWRYTSEDVISCLESLTSDSAERKVIYFEGDSRMRYIMQHLYKYYLKSLPKTNISL